MGITARRMGLRSQAAGRGMRSWQAETWISVAGRVQSATGRAGERRRRGGAEVLGETWGCMGELTLYFSILQGKTPGGK